MIGEDGGRDPRCIEWKLLGIGGTKIAKRVTYLLPCDFVRKLVSVGLKYAIAVCESYLLYFR